jgi:hypothetical protein
MPSEEKFDAIKCMIKTHEREYLITAQKLTPRKITKNYMSEMRGGYQSKLTLASLLGANQGTSLKSTMVLQKTVFKALLEKQTNCEVQN